MKIPTPDISKYITRERVDKVREMIPVYGYFFKRGQEEIRLTDSESQPRYNRAFNSDFRFYHVLTTGISAYLIVKGLEGLF